MLNVLYPNTLSMQIFDKLTRIAGTCQSCTKDNAKVRLQVHEAVPKRQFFLEDYGIFHRGLLITNNIICRFS